MKAIFSRWLITVLVIAMNSNLCMGQERAALSPEDSLKIRKLATLAISQFYERYEPDSSLVNYVDVVRIVGSAFGYSDEVYLDSINLVRSDSFAFRVFMFASHVELFMSAQEVYNKLERILATDDERFRTAFLCWFLMGERKGINTQEGYSYRIENDFNYRWVIKTKESMLEYLKLSRGTEHPLYMMMLSSLAQSYHAILAVAKAHQCYFELLELLDKKVGNENVEITKTVYRMERFFSYVKEFPAIVRLMTFYRKVCEKLYGETSYGVIWSLWRKGNASMHNKDYLNALNDYKEAWMMCDIKKDNNYKKRLELRIKEATTKLGRNYPPDWLTISQEPIVDNETLLDRIVHATTVNDSVKLAAYVEKTLSDRNFADSIKTEELSNLLYWFYKNTEYSQRIDVLEKINILIERIPRRYNIIHRYLVYMPLYEYYKEKQDSLRLAQIVEKMSRFAYYVTYDRTSLRYFAHDFELIDALGEIASQEFLFNSAKYYATDTKNYQKAIRDCEKLVSFVFAQTKSTFQKSTEKERDKFWKNNIGYLSLPQTLAYYFEGFDNEFMGTVYNSQLLNKGLLLNSTIELRRIIAESSDDDVAAMYERFITLSQSVKSERDKVTLDSLERELVEQSAVFGEYTAFMRIQWQDVQAALGVDDTAVEFVDFDTMEGRRMYAALVVRKGWDNPKMVPLFEADLLFTRKIGGQTLNQLIKSSAGISKDSIYTCTWLGDSILTPLLPYIVPGGNLYFAASGQLHAIAIEYLPAPLKCNFHRLSSTRELVIRKSHSKGSTAVLYGGLDYNHIASQKVSATVDEPIRTDYSLLRIINRLNNASYLPATMEEITSIDSILTQKKVQCRVYSGASGDKQSFISLSGKQNRIIHLATHGLYLTANDSLVLNNLFKKERFVDTGEDNSLSRAMLLLSGANRTLSENSVVEENNGILTARDISTTDLRGADLIVLSACQSGLGDITNEGVFGLQRGFKKAGSGSILMSLWPVDDRATKLLMSEFYYGLSNLLPPKRALTQAQEALRNYSKNQYVVRKVERFDPKLLINRTEKSVVSQTTSYRSPRYWAAFVLLD